MRRILAIVLILVLLGGGYSFWALNKPLPLLQPVNILPTLPAQEPNPLTWPGSTQAAVGATGYGVLATNGEQKPLPTASVAKVMAALSVLQKRPLKLGEQGPTFTVGDQDINFYYQYVAAEGSVVPVNSGEEISEYQALQAMLLPSANNIAKSLVTWVFGSEQNYTAYANAYAKQLGCKQTTITDASGFSPSTTSTASDLVLLGEAALQNPVLAQIVSQTDADIPVAGAVHNVNELLGRDGINGIKTGNTDQAGGVFLASGTYTAAGNHKVTIVSAVVGAPTLRAAMDNSLPLLVSSQTNFVETKVINQQQIVGYYNTPWHTSTNAEAAFDLTAFGWKGALSKPQLSMQKVHVPAKEGQTIGTLTLKDAAGNSTTTQVTLQQPVPAPS
ncbi:MAG TPA: hypothetical protein VFI84_03820, partial [Candidatus Saccharimonadales bacterium]|nr:hypothetical protein [Candidatus Saccharimonadales bacterium]